MQEIQENSKSSDRLSSYPKDEKTNFDTSENNNTNNNNNNDNDIEHFKDEKKSFMEIWTDFMLKYSPSLLLENKGATARDHLANERTYLAYLRTSLSSVTVGVAITQLFRINNTANENAKAIKSGEILGAVFVCIGLLFVAFGLIRYFFSQTLLTRGLFPASRGSVVVGSILVVLAMVVAFVLTIVMS